MVEVEPVLQRIPLYPEPTFKVVVFPWQTVTEGGSVVEGVPFLNSIFKVPIFAQKPGTLIR